MSEPNDNAASSWNEHYRAHGRVDDCDYDEIEPGTVDTLQGMRYDHIACQSKKDPPDSAIHKF